MHSDDDELSIHFSDEGSDGGFSPEPVKRKPAAKKAAAPRKTMAPKKATAAAKPKATSKKRVVPSDDEDDEGNLADTPPSAKKQKKAPAPKRAKTSAKPLQSKQNESELDGDDGDLGEGSGSSKDKKSFADSYQKLTQLEHILKRPDTYVGSVERSERHMWVFDSGATSMVWKSVTMVPGLYKIFDEILVNAADNKIRDSKMDTLKVTVDKATNTISVYNNGRGIPIEIHSKEKVYVPELIFGHLLTSSNYDDDEKKVTGGRNGYGAKLCNIFSTEFTVETGDKNTKQKYIQTWTDNMGKMGKAKITTNPKGEQFTKITFKPDLAKFHMEEMDDDFEALVKRRVYDMAASVKDVKVFLNGERIKLNFKKYCEMYINALHEEAGGEEKPVITWEVVNDRWEVAFAASGGNFQQVSFVNSIATTSGGTHVNYIADQLCTHLQGALKKQNKSGAAVKNAQMRNHFFIFVNCLIENPAFTSQTKEQLTTRSSAFGSKCALSDTFIKNVLKNTPVISNIIDYANMKADKQLKKTDGSRRSRINNPKLIDANRAGTKDSQECVLILTEGDSARSLAVAGISAIDGRDRFGVFPLRGKLLNVRDASHDQIMKNAEIQNIKQILGLQHKKVYESRKELRYGHLMIMTDQDYDGSHIKGLLINFFETQFPSLLKLSNFLIEFITPIVKVFKGGVKKPTKEISFFTMPEYEYWKENNAEKGWEHKYYKGLGTSGERDAKLYFSDLERHVKEFHVMEEEGQRLIELAFSKKKADERKEWLRLYKPGTYLDHSIDKISYPEFVNKELILFSMADNIRSIPSVVDGLKPGQRKILFACFKRKLTKQLKVSELSGFVSECTAYQHGESSLQVTITGMAQTFVGSNNVNLLEPEGSFGTRLDGGKDAASPRYIYTLLSPFARKLFPATDDPLLAYNLDDDKKIEPMWYAPVVPLVLINGADGIGTGWSTTIPNYNPEDVVANIRRLMNNEELESMTPWYRDWTGKVEQVAVDKFKFSGIINQIDDVTCEIRELPIKMWTQEFKEKLEEIIKGEKSFIKDYVDYNSPRRVHFIITMESEKHMQEALAEGLVNKFKLTKNISTSNLVAFDPEGRINKYASVNDILKEFYYVRLKYYQERKDNMLKEMGKQLMKYTNQARFVQMIIKKELVVSGRKRSEIIEDLMKKRFDKISNKAEAQKAGETEDTVEEEDSTVGDGYNYLLGMAIWSLTHEKVQKLLQDVAEKELEIDELIKRSPKDLWNTELDAFIEEWKIQLEEDKKEQGTVVKRKKNGKYGAKIAKGKKKAAGSDGSDFEASKPKRKPAAAKVKTEAKKQTVLGFKSIDQPPEKAPDKKPIARAAKKEAVVIDDLSDSDFDMLDRKSKPVPSARPPVKVIPADVESSPDQKPQPDPAGDSEDEFLSLGEKPSPPKPKAKAVPAKKPTKDESEAESEIEVLAKKTVAKPAPKAKAATKTAPKTKPIAADDSIFDLDVSDPPPLRAATTKPKRAAAAKPSILDIAGSDDSDGENGLGDVSVLVKGIGSQGSDTGRPLFRDSAKKASGAALKGVAAKKVAPKGVSKIPLDLRKNAGDRSENSDSDDIPRPVKKALVKKAAPPARAAPKKAAEPKKPAAKAAPKARTRKPISLSDEDEDEDDMDVDKMADELLDSDDGELYSKPSSKTSKAATKPSVKPAPKAAEPESRGRAVRARKQTNYKIDLSSDEEDDDDDDDEGSEDYGGDSD